MSLDEARIFCDEHAAAVRTLTLTLTPHTTRPPLAPTPLTTTPLARRTALPLAHPWPPSSPSTLSFSTPLLFPYSSPASHGSLLAGVAPPPVGTVSALFIESALPALLERSHHCAGGMAPANASTPLMRLQVASVGEKCGGFTVDHGPKMAEHSENAVQLYARFVKGVSLRVVLDANHASYVRIIHSAQLKEEL